MLVHCIQGGCRTVSSAGCCEGWSYESLDASITAGTRMASLQILAPNRSCLILQDQLQRGEYALRLLTGFSRLYTLAT